MSCSRKQPIEVAEVYRQIEYYCLVVTRKKSDDSTRYLLDRIGNTIKKCFNYKRTKPQYNGTKNYRFNRKVNGSKLNLQEIVAEKF